MNLCGNCKFWGKVGDQPQNGFKTCQAVIHGRGGYVFEEQSEFDCCVIDESDSFIKEQIELRQKKALAVDGSGYYAAIKTKDDFGCVLFEQA